MLLPHLDTWPYSLPLAWLPMEHMVSLFQLLLLTCFLIGKAEKPFFPGIKSELGQSVTQDDASLNGLSALFAVLCLQNRETFGSQKA